MWLDPKQCPYRSSAVVSLPLYPVPSKSKEHNFDWMQGLSIEPGLEVWLCR